MKKAVSILIFVLAFTVTVQAQKRHKKGKWEKLTTEQQATLASKKMALALDLSDAQQRQIKPLLTQQIADKKANWEKMKKFKESDKKLTADERFRMQNARLDKQLAFQKQMKRILNDEQYAKFKKMKKHRKHKMKRYAKKRKMRRHRR